MLWFQALSKWFGFKKFKLLVENIKRNTNLHYKSSKTSWDNYDSIHPQNQGSFLINPGKDIIYKYFCLITVPITCSFLHYTQKALPLVFLSTLKSNWKEIMLGIINCPFASIKINIINSSREISDLKLGSLEQGVMNRPCEQL